MRRGAALVALLGLALGCGENPETCRPVQRPSDADLAAVIGRDPDGFIDRVLSVIEEEIVPLTQQGVRGGSKVFGGAVLRKDDLATVVAVTNSESQNPLDHGEINALNAFWALPRAARPAPGDAIFLSTHEPCPLCLSGITWSGFDNFFYLFSYEDSKDAFDIPHDLEILEEVFRCPDGSYSEKNAYWSSWSLQELIRGRDAEARAGFETRLASLRASYDEMSNLYQRGKEGGADIPLK